MHLAPEQRPMPKGRPKSSRDDATTKFDRKLLEKARGLAKIRGVSTAEYISESARESIEKDFDQYMRSLDKREGKQR